MSRKVIKKTAKKTAKKPAKKPARNTPKQKAMTAYVVVRSIDGEVPAHTEPERIFAAKSAALKLADERNREMKSLCNPFELTEVDDFVTGGEKALLALVKKLRLPIPKKVKPYGFAYIDWEAWWDGHYFDMTDDQRNAIWDALDKYNWYTVKTTKVEG